MNSLAGRAGASGLPGRRNRKTDDDEHVQASSAIAPHLVPGLHVWVRHRHGLTMPAWHLPGARVVPELPEHPVHELSGSLQGKVWLAEDVERWIKDRRPDLQDAEE